MSATFFFLLSAAFNVKSSAFFFSRQVHVPLRAYYSSNSLLLLAAFCFDRLSSCSVGSLLLLFAASFFCRRPSSSVAILPCLSAAFFFCRQPSRSVGILFRLSAAFFFLSTVFAFSRLSAFCFLLTIFFFYRQPSPSFSSLPFLSSAIFYQPHPYVGNLFLLLAVFAFCQQPSSFVCTLL